MKRGPTLKTLQRQCNDWNAKVKVGDLVQYRSTLDANPQTFVTHTEATILSGHTAVLWLRGRSGCVALDHCEPVKS